MGSVPAPLIFFLFLLRKLDEQKVKRFKHTRTTRLESNLLQRPRRAAAVSPSGPLIATETARGCIAPIGSELPAGRRVQNAAPIEKFRAHLRGAPRYETYRDDTNRRRAPVVGKRESAPSSLGALSGRDCVGREF